MSENFKQLQHVAVHRCHSALKASGANPDLAQLRGQIIRLEGIHLSESEIAEFLNEPLESGRRGTSKKSEQAHRASCRAANLSAEAVDSMPESHIAAAKAHGEAARAHRVAAIYHDQQFSVHDKVAFPTVTDQSKADEPQPEETGAPLSCARALPSLLGDTAAPVPDVFMYMPGGVFTISPSQGGRPVTVTVSTRLKTRATNKCCNRALLPKNRKSPDTTPEQKPVDFRATSCNTKSA